LQKKLNPHCVDYSLKDLRAFIIGTSTYWQWSNYL